MIERDSNRPPYVQVAAILRAEIESGKRPRGSRLPSIVDLVQEYGIARGTAAKALRLLVDEGIAEVTHGWGTYVRENPVSH